MDSKYRHRFSIIKLIHTMAHWVSKYVTFKFLAKYTEEERNNGGDPETATLGSNCRYSYSRSEDFVARGSYGSVFKAKITMRGNFVGQGDIAVKDVSLYDLGLWDNPESFKKLRDRWGALVRLQHNHLVHFHKISFTTRPGFLSAEFLMDYYQDGDLSALLKKQTTESALLDRCTALSYAIQIADGAAYLHNNKIIHGDLKPSNVLVKRQENRQHVLLIADLDDIIQMRCSVTSVRDVTSVHGTYRYMSPEMLRNKVYQMSDEHVGRKTDVWSLGCIALELARATTEITRTDENRLCSIYDFDCTVVVSDAVIPEKVRDGFVPHVSDQFPISLAACIRKCFRVPSETRPLARELLSLLRKETETFSNSVPEIIVQSQVLPPECHTLKWGTTQLSVCRAEPVHVPVTQEQFRTAVTGIDYWSKEPADEQYWTFAKFALMKGKIDTKRELAMFLANILHESDGLQATEKYGPPYLKAAGDPAHPRLSYHGRGYMMLRGFPIYKEVSNGLYGNEFLVKNPDLVKSEVNAWDTAFWFWANKIHGLPETAEGRFKISGDIISGGNNFEADKRFDIYKRVLEVFEPDCPAVD